MKASDLTDETGAWDLVASYVAPVSVLRSTVQAWAGSDAKCLVRHATAANLLLLLDVDLLETMPNQARHCVHFQRTACCRGKSLKAPFVNSGEVQAFDLVPAPTVHLDPSGPVSMRLRDARVDVSWLEAGCSKLAGRYDAKHDLREACCPSLQRLGKSSATCKPLAAPGWVCP